MTKVSCWICHRYSAANLLAVLRHMGAVHSHDPTFHTFCGIEGCPRAYKNYHSFRKHVYRKHREFLREDTDNLLDSQQDEQDEQEEEVNAEPISSDDEHEHSTCSNLEELTFAEEKRQIALFVLKCKVAYKISQSALNGLIDDISSLISRKMEYVHDNVVKIISSRSDETLERINSLFQSLIIANPFSGLETKYHQQKYIDKEFGLLVS